MHKLKRLALKIHHPHHLVGIETVISVSACFLILVGQASAVTRFENRDLTVNPSLPGVTATYTVSMEYQTLTSIGSLEMQFCEDPIPSEPCVTPYGLNVANAVLSSQSGETGYSITQRSSSELVLSRTPSVPVGGVQSTYVLTNVINPTTSIDSYSIRLSDYASTNASGTVVDLGSVETELSNGIELETQVTPMLIFCAGEEVSEDCSTIDDNNYADLGTLNPNSTLTSQSQMAAGTNASQGYVITANGTSMEAGNSVINSPTSPTASIPGTNEFGINLVANTDPNIGQDPDLSGDIAQPTTNYDQPNKYMYQDGDVVAESPAVSLVQKYTISYILNASANAAPGVYTTTITYVCSGRF